MNLESFVSSSDAFSGGFAQLLHAFVQRRLTRAALFGASLLVAWLGLILGAP